MSSYPNHTPKSPPPSTEDDPIREGIELFVMMPDEFLRAIVAGKVDVKRIASEILAAQAEADSL